MSLSNFLNGTLSGSGGLAIAVVVLIIFVGIPFAIKIITELNQAEQQQ